MMSMSKNDFIVFSRYKHAPTNAFGSKKNPKAFVSIEDKEKYTRIYNSLKSIAEIAISMPSLSNLKLKAMNYSAQYGSRGHRPVDMWMSICGVDSDDFGKMPQIYIIASERGIEIGFAVSINENDYHDVEVKQRNRMIVPRIVSKLPSPTSNLVKAINDKLVGTVEKVWHFNQKARLNVGDSGFDEFGNLQSMISKLKTSSDVSGGGSIAKFIPTNEIDYDFVKSEFMSAAEIFYPLMMDCQPSSLDKKNLEIDAIVQEETKKFVFDAQSLEDARIKTAKMIAARRGQKKFRDDLLKAYDCRCAITECDVIQVLEAAHILAYRGDHTNHVANGILLRGDIHTLFDLGLIKINPKNYMISVDISLKNSMYQKYDGAKLRLPLLESNHPDNDLLVHKWESY